MRMSIILTTLFLFSMSLHSQNFFKALGVKEYTIGTNIRDLPELINIKQHSDAKYFMISPMEKYFYTLESKSLANASQTTLKFTIFIVDEAGTVRKIKLFLDDSNNTIVSILKQTFGDESTYGEVSDNNGVARAYHYWDIHDNHTLSFAKKNYINTLMKYPVSTIEIFDSKDVDYLSNYLIDLRPELPVNLRSN